MSFNLATILQESARTQPSAPLAYINDRVISYAELDAESNKVAAGLLATGLVHGDRVAVQLGNIPEFLLSYFGILKAGMVMVPLNPMLRPREIAYHLADSASAAFITADAELDRAAMPAAETPGAAEPQIFVVGNEVGSFRNFSDLLEPVSSKIKSHSKAATNAQDTAVIIYTSGTTGKPKGAELTHFQLYMNCTVSGELVGYTPEATALAVLPLFHIFGLSSVLNAAVRFGSAVALVPRFKADTVLSVIESHRVAIFPGVPTMFASLLHADSSAYDLSSLRRCISGGSAMPEEVLRGFETKFPSTVILEGYGSSESASVVTFNVSESKRKTLSIGMPIWGVNVRLVDSSGSVIPTDSLHTGHDHVGELQFSGHNVMKGYFGKPAETNQALKDGWFSTGDLGYRDTDGYYFLVDRKKDLVIRGGYNVYSREVEEILYEHPAVAEAAVIGRPHPVLGEEVCAVISLVTGSNATAQEIVDFAKERLAPYKYPREIEFLEVLPKGPSGKILKRELRAPAPA